MSGQQSYGGRYGVLEKVGSGGMAEVYRARDELLGREVALKVLHARFSQDHSFVERFRREAQSAANLNHPNIVSLYDYGSDGGAYYIVMEFIEGRSLADVIREDGPLMPERAAEIASDVAAALERAHNAGIVHRDVKPGNIMITSGGQTKVTDFGIARALSASDGEQTMTQTGMVIGTAAYLSPEQAQGTPVDARSDVYALGVVLYEMLTGEPPFSGDTPLSIAYKHVREQPPPLATTQPGVPAAIAAITMKALAKNPDNRYADAGEMREDLARFLAGQQVHATPVLAEETMIAPRQSRTEVMSRTATYEPEEEEESRRAGWYVLGAVLLLALIGLLAYLVANNFLGDDPEPPATVEVPNVKGKSEDRARSILEDLGLSVRTVDRNSARPEGRVIGQQPAAGDEVEEGTEVLLTISEGLAQVEVPDLSGMTLSEAEAALEAADLELGEATDAPSDEVEEGKVFQQTIAAGTSVDSGTTVGVTVSTGAEPVTVPYVVGLSEEEAKATIRDAQLEPEVQTQPADEEEGTVIAQDPDQGTSAEPGDVVTILVSEGPEEREMPDVTGQDGDDAERFLEDEYGLEVEQVEEACSEPAPPGTVCRQDPEPGTPVSAGDPATLYVQPLGNGALDRPTSWALLTGWLRFG